MKARLLKKILNNTGYSVGNYKEYIGVGSPLCHNLINVDKKTLTLKYALDTWKDGRNSIDNTELLFIWDKLQELVDNGQIKDIIEGVDEIETPLPVYTIEDSKLVETFTDNYGWPNTTIDGYIMYDNTYFKTKEEAIDYGISECKSAISLYDKILNDDIEKMKEAKSNLSDLNSKLIELIYQNERTQNYWNIQFKETKDKQP